MTPWVVLSIVFLDLVSDLIYSPIQQLLNNKGVPDELGEDQASIERHMIQLAQAKHLVTTLQ